MREKLQVLKEFKDESRGELVVRKYRVKAGKELPSREGYIGDLKTGVNKGPKPVSYTHLDVYKRQVLLRGAPQDRFRAEPRARRGPGSSAAGRHDPGRSGLIAAPESRQLSDGFGRARCFLPGRFFDFPPSGLSA